MKTDIWQKMKRTAKVIQQRELTKNVEATIGAVVLAVCLGTPYSAINTIKKHFLPTPSNTTVFFTPSMLSFGYGNIFRILTRLSNPKSAIVTGAHLGTLFGLSGEIEHHVRTEGTYDVLKIQAHGTSSEIALSQNHRYAITELLEEMNETHKRAGRPLAKRIEFFSCNLARNPDASTIKNISNYARNMGCEIVLATTPVLAFFEQAEYACFHPDGTITRDANSTHSTVSIVYNHISSVDHLSWLPTYNGKTPDEGAKDFETEQLTSPKGVLGSTPYRRANRYLQSRDNPFRY